MDIKRAACHGEDTDLWFSYDPVHQKEAKRHCAECPIREDCLKYALDRNQQYGIWGGLGEQERRALRRKMNLPILEEQTA